MGILNFVIAGAQRSATTSLKKAMSEHPEIGFLSNKEEALSHHGDYVGFPFATPFFSRSFPAMLESQSVYESISRSGGEARYLGAKWPYFMIWPHIACNLRQHLPGIRLLFILRNPMDCLWSSFKKSYKGRSIQDDFGAFVRNGLNSIESGWKEKDRGKWAHMLYGSGREAVALDRGFYFPQLLNFVLLFGWYQIHVINYNDFAGKPMVVMNRLFKWMDLKPLPRMDSLKERHNSAQEHAPDNIAQAPMVPQMRAELTAFYEPSNRRLCEYLGWDYNCWIGE